MTRASPQRKAKREKWGVAKGFILSDYSSKDDMIQDITDFARHLASKGLDVTVRAKGRGLVNVMVRV